MATQNVPIVQPAYIDPSARGAEAETPHPFKVSVLRLDDNQRDCYVTVSRNCAVFDSLYSNNRVPLIGMGIERRLTENKGLVIETFHDKNRSPVFSVIRNSTGRSKSSPPWVNVASNYRPVDMIKQSQIGAASAALGEVMSIIEEMQGAAIATISSWVANGIIPAASQGDYLTQTVNGYAKCLALCINLGNDLYHFFDGCPNLPSAAAANPSFSNDSAGRGGDNIWLKQFRSFVPICFLNPTADASIDGKLIQYYPSERGNDAGVNTPMHLMQILKTNIAFVDGLYDNTYPIKMPIPVASDVSLFVP